MLRADPGAVGLVSGVGMHMTKHVFGVYCDDARAGRAAGRRADARTLDRSRRSRSSPSTTATRPSRAYSVVHGRDGAPEWALLVCDLADGARTYAQRLDDPDLRADRRSATSSSDATVQLAPTTVDGPMGAVRVNVATW